MTWTKLKLPHTIEPGYLYAVDADKGLYRCAEPRPWCPVTDGPDPWSPEGRQALIDYVRTAFPPEPSPDEMGG